MLTPLVGEDWRHGFGANPAFRQPEFRWAVRLVMPDGRRDCYTYRDYESACDDFDEIKMEGLADYVSLSDSGMIEKHWQRPGTVLGQKGDDDD